MKNEKKKRIYRNFATPKQQVARNCHVDIANFEEAEAYHQLDNMESADSVHSTHYTHPPAIRTIMAGIGSGRSSEQKAGYRGQCRTRGLRILQPTHHRRRNHQRPTADRHDTSTQNVGENRTASTPRRSCSHLVGTALRSQGKPLSRQCRLHAQLSVCHRRPVVKGKGQALEARPSHRLAYYSRPIVSL